MSAFRSRREMNAAIREFVEQHPPDPATDPAVPATAPQPAPLDLDAIEARLDACDEPRAVGPLADGKRLVAEVRRLRAALDRTEAARANLQQNAEILADELVLGNGEMTTEQGDGFRRERAILRWAADRWRAEAIGVNEWDTEGALRRWADELDAAPAAPRTYELPAEPEFTELWDRADYRWERQQPYGWCRDGRHDDSTWCRWPWFGLLDQRGPLSTVPPAGTACPNCDGIGPESCPRCSPAAGTEGDRG